MDINDLVLSDKALSVIDNGTWIPAGDAAPGVEFLVTGMQSDKAKKLNQTKIAKIRRENRGKPLSAEQASRVTKEVLVEEVLKDWKGLESNGKELPYSKEMAEKFILSRGGDRFAGLVLFAAQSLDEDANSYVDEVSKN